LKRFLEDLVEWGAQTISIRIRREASTAPLSVEAGFSQSVLEVSEHRLKPYRRQFALSGGQINVQFLPKAVKFEVRFE
jgi:hypothetical protein